MSTLHIVNKSPFATRALMSCLNHAKPGDAVLMTEDGVYGGMDGTEISEHIAGFGKTLTLCVLSPDLAARGIDSNRLIDGIEGVDYTGFVDLVAKHDRTQSWL